MSMALRSTARSITSGFSRSPQAVRTTGASRNWRARRPTSGHLGGADRPGPLDLLDPLAARRDLAMNFLDAGLILARRRPRQIAPKSTQSLQHRLQLFLLLSRDAFQILCHRDQIA